MFIQVNKNSETRINRNPTEELFIMLKLHSLITMTFSLLCVGLLETLSAKKCDEIFVSISLQI